MPQFKVTTKRSSGSVNGVAIEAGMTTIVTCHGGQWSSEFKEAVQEAFLERLGVDLEKGCYLGANYLDVKQMAP